MTSLTPTSIGVIRAFCALPPERLPHASRYAYSKTSPHLIGLHLRVPCDVGGAAAVHMLADMRPGKLTHATRERIASLPDDGIEAWICSVKTTDLLRSEIRTAPGSPIQIVRTWV